MPERIRFTPAGTAHQRLAYEPTARVTASPPPTRYAFQPRDGKNKSSVPKPAPIPDPGEEDHYTPRGEKAVPVPAAAAVREHLRETDGRVAVVGLSSMADITRDYKERSTAYLA